MSPQGPRWHPSQSGRMDPIDSPEFEAALTAWMDDETPSAVSGVVAQAPSQAYEATQRAMASAATHTTCPVDERPFGVFVKVIGKDGAISVQSIPPGLNVTCVLGALRQDPVIRTIMILGWDTEPDVPKSGPDDLGTPGSDDLGTPGSDDLGTPGPNPSTAPSATPRPAARRPLPPLPWGRPAPGPRAPRSWAWWRRP